MHACIHACILTYMHANLRACIRMCVLNTHTNTPPNIQAPIYIRPCIHIHAVFTGVFMRTCTGSCRCNIKERAPKGSQILARE